MSYWTPERLRDFLAHRPSYRERCDGIGCGNFPQWQCFHCANAFCFDCALKHFGLPLESEHPECSRQPDPDTAAEPRPSDRMVERFREAAHQIGNLFCWCVENLQNFPPMKGDFLDDIKRRLKESESQAKEIERLKAHIELHRALHDWEGVQCEKNKGWAVPDEAKVSERLKSAKAALFALDSKAAD